MRVKTDNMVYETAFSHAQIEITGACNMNCAHCRACDEAPIFMSCEEIRSILDFAAANRGKTFNLTVSGGEPLIHPDFLPIMTLIRTYPFDEIVVTTNGSLITPEILQALDGLRFPDLTIQISLDSIHPHTHDSRRGYPGAFDTAAKSLQLLRRYPHLNSSVRMTVTRETLHEVEEMVRLLAGWDVRRLGVGSVIPAGRGTEGSQILTSEEKRGLIFELSRLHKEWAGRIDIVTEDPLKCLVSDNPWISEQYYAMKSNPAVFGGCTAGIDCFNVNTHYEITPCSVFPEPIVDDIRAYPTVAALTAAYADSPLLRRLCSRRYDGRCNSCSNRRICGGCRATAHYFGGSYFSSDGTCWLKGGEENGEERCSGNLC